MLVPLASVQPYEATHAYVAPRAAEPSPSAAPGEKFLTPIIAGSICGGVLFILWGIGFAVYFKKRYRRKQRNRLIAAGKAEPRPKDLEVPKEKIVIPPDPAVLLGQHQPGEILFPERQHSKDRRHRHMPRSTRHGSYSRAHGESSTTLPTQPLQDEIEGSIVVQGPEESIVDETVTVPSRL